MAECHGPLGDLGPNFENHWFNETVKPVKCDVNLCGNISINLADIERRCGDRERERTRRNQESQALTAAAFKDKASAQILYTNSSRQNVADAQTQ